ncbi:MAG: hypothetical protein WC840_00350 [Candidatus Peribacteraceae bacterium]
MDLQETEEVHAPPKLLQTHFQLFRIVQLFGPFPDRILNFWLHSEALFLEDESRKFVEVVQCGFRDFLLELRWFFLGGLRPLVHIRVQRHCWRS